MRSAETDALCHRVGRSRATIYRWTAEGMPHDFGGALTWVARHHPALLGEEDSADLVEWDDRQRQVAARFGALAAAALDRLTGALAPDLALPGRSGERLGCAIRRLVEEAAGLQAPSWGWECPLPAGPIGDWVSGSPPPAAGEGGAAS